MITKTRNWIISIVVIIWLSLFFYESTRHFFLAPIIKQRFNVTLPKVKLLFPPAGWIMFFQVNEQFGYAKVYSKRNGSLQEIDHHDIIETRTIGYDNTYRNILSTVLREGNRRQFCRFLMRKFPHEEGFVITQVYYPDVTNDRYDRRENIVYQCESKN